MPPFLLAFGGLPGVGKSTLAREVARRTSAVWLRVDAAEAAMLEAGLTRSFETGVAAYLVARNVGAEQLQIGRDVVVDAVNGVEEARATWRDLARDSGARLLFVEVTCSDRDEHRRRVESRATATPPLPVTTWAELSQWEYQPWKDPVLSIDTIRPPSECVARILARVAEQRR
jgi:predicted kinase